MRSLVHRVKIFVCRSSSSGSGPEYLLLRRSQGIESFWRPVDGEVGYDEKLESAIRREVLEDVGLERPVEIVDLEMPGRWIIGDEEVIEWTYGFRTLPGEIQLQLAPTIAQARWSMFTEAYPSLELDPDRAAIMRLHTLLGT